MVEQLGEQSRAERAPNQQGGTIDDALGRNERFGSTEGRHLIGVDLVLVDEAIKDAHQEVLAPVGRQRVDLHAASSDTTCRGSQAAEALGGARAQQVGACQPASQLLAVLTAETLQHARRRHPPH